MTDTPPHASSKKKYWMILWAGLLVVVLANLHLVYVAVSSQPECVAHVRSDVEPAAKGSFAAANSAC
tara:strand:+ start:1115 stop:1315 length:201 start_codon:yes stop_codon:yes gene_type:complete